MWWPEALSDAPPPSSGILGVARTSAPIVSIVSRTLPRYRIPFYQGLRVELGRRDIELRLIHGQSARDEVSRSDTGSLEWAHQIRNRSLGIGSREFFWQPCISLLRGSDLVIMEQASKLLLNYPLSVAQHLGGPRHALWGHGRNLREHASSRVGEALKRVISRRAHWWFAYTESSAAIVRDLGYPEERISVVQNAVDGSPSIERRARTSERELAELREALDLRGTNVAIYAGGLYAEKRVPFMLEACREIRRRIPDFEFIVVGGGPEQHRVEDAARELDWLHYVGPKFDDEKVAYFVLAKLMLIPGLVGLGVNDAFIFETPPITVDLPYHSPEIDYLVHGENGLKLESGVDATQYGSAVADLMLDTARLERLRGGCRAAAQRYTMEAMVERFATGVERALAS